MKPANAHILTKLDKERNAKSATIISTHANPVTVRVIRTDEELMIARSVAYKTRLGCA